MWSVWSTFFFPHDVIDLACRIISDNSIVLKTLKLAVFMIGNQLPHEIICCVKKNQLGIILSTKPEE